MWDEPKLGIGMNVHACDNERRVSKLGEPLNLNHRERLLRFLLVAVVVLVLQLFLCSV